MRRANGTIQIFTFKEGMLSRVAHDLQIRLEKFEITLDGEAVRADFDLKTLFVDGPVEDGSVRLDGYDAGKKADVQKAMHGEVLHTDEHPQAAFVGKAIPQGSGFKVSGELSMAGKKQPLAFDVTNTGGTYRAQFEIEPSHWGIAQYKALLGAIRLKDRIRIEFALTET